MAVINTGLLAQGLKSEFFQRYDGTKTHFADLSTRIQSNSDQETYKWLGSLPRMREWGTGRLAKGIRTESYSIANLKYESTIEVDRDEISDDKTGQIRIRIGELAERTATHRDYLISQLLANGATAGFLAYDGKTFFAADHESGASGVQTNLEAASATDPADPSTAEMKTALKSAIATLMGLKDDVGDPLNLTTGGLVLVCPTNHHFAAMEALNATVISSTSNVLAGAATVIPFPWLTNTAKSYLLKTDGVVRPFVFQDREAPEFTSLTEDSDEGFKREKYQFGVRARYRMTYGLWQQAVEITFS